MLKGLKICEQTFSTINGERSKRLEAEFYISRTTSQMRSFDGRDIISLIQYGTSKELNEEKKGYPVLRLNEFESFFIGTPEKYCDKITRNDFSSLRICKGDVLICRTNGNPNLVGRAAVVMTDTQYAYASYLFKVRPKKDMIQPEVLMLFLRSKFGREQINKYSMTGNQTNFSPAKFREIHIPYFQQTFQMNLVSVVGSAYFKLKESNRLYHSAESFLLEELGISGWLPPMDRTSVRSFKDYRKTRRLDAEYYQPKYDALLNQLKPFQQRSLGGPDGIVSIFKSIEPGSEAYLDKGIPFVRIADMTKFGISDPEIHLSGEEFSDAELRPRKDTILFSKDGSVGIAYKVEQNLDIITSGGILHLTINPQENVLPDYLTLILNSIVVGYQAERDAGGSIIQHWKPSEIEKVVIPILPDNIQKRISEQVQESFRLRAESKRLLNAAKNAVEMAIEQNEDTALASLRAEIEV